MIIHLPSFNGITPKANAEALAPTAAQDAVNCNFIGGSLTGLRNNVKLDLATTPAGSPIKSGFVWSHTDPDDGRTAWQAYAWPYDTDAVRSPVQNDKHNRFYWTGRKQDGSTEFKYALVADPSKTSTYGEPPNSYKIGVIDSSQWDYTFESIFLRVRATQVGFPLTVAEIAPDTMTVKLYAVDSSGSIEAGTYIPYTSGASLTPRDGTQVNGQHMGFDVVLPKDIDQYGEAISGGVTYQSYKATLTYDNSSESAQEVTVWHSGNPAAPVAVRLNSGRPYPTIMFYEPYFSYFPTSESALTARQAVAGDQVGIALVSDSGTYRVTMKFVSEAGLVTPSMSTMPTGLTVTTAGELQLAAVWTFKDTNGKFYEGTYYENESLNDPIVIGSTTVQLSITSTDDINFALDVQAGYDLPLETRAYIVTMVNQLGEESPPSDPVEITLNPGNQTATFTIEASRFLSTYPTINDGRYPGNGFRFYRTATASTGDTEFLYAFSLGGDDVGGTNLDGDVYAEKTISYGGLFDMQQTWTFSDTTDNAALGAPCPTVNNVRNTEELQQLQGLTAINNGMFAAFKDNEVWVSESYTPWAFRSNAIKPLPHKVVSLVALEAGFIALTELSPYYFSGQTPEQMQPQRIPSEYPCVGKNAAVPIGAAVLYVSPDGPVTINGMQAVIDTSAWSRESWREEYGSQMLRDHIELASYGHRVIAYFPGKANGYVFDTEDGNWTRTTTRMDCTMHLPANSFVYTFDQIAYSDGDSAYPRWTIYAASNDNGKGAFTWHSKRFTLPKPTNFGALQIYGSGSCTVDVFVDGALSYTTPTLTLGTAGVIARLPSGFLSAKWSFRINGDADTTINALNVATTISELQGV